MKSRIEKLKVANEVVNHANPVMKEEVDWIIDVAEYYESKIKELHNQQLKLDNAEFDGFDFGEAVSDIINSTHLRI